MCSLNVSGSWKKRKEDVSVISGDQLGMRAKCKGEPYIGSQKINEMCKKNIEHWLMPIKLLIIY